MTASPAERETEAPRSERRSREDERLRRFTVDEYHAMAESGILGEDERVELIEGRIWNMTPVGSEHASHTKKIASLLRRLEPDRALIGVQDPVRLGETGEPEPDISVLEPRDDFYHDAHPTPEAVYLLVEIAETSADTDRDVKLPSYARHGVPVVWLVDLGERRVEVYRDPDGGAYGSVEIPGDEDAIEIPGLEGFSLQVGDLFIAD